MSRVWNGLLGWIILVGWIVNNKSGNGCWAFGSKSVQSRFRTRTATATHRSHLVSKLVTSKKRTVLSAAALEERGGGKVDEPHQPTLAELRNFYIPCLALWISGPLLSLVDTASVGLSAAKGEGAQQLGALGPATTFIDGSLYLFAFLNVATTNLYASALARKEDGGGVVRTAAKISLICGAFLTCLLLFAGPNLLRMYVGDNDSIVRPAASYVKIRAWSMPTSLLGGVLQAALLGSKDSVTPLIAIIYSTVVNVFGDYFCVVMKKMGTDGAALATLLAQWAGTAAMIGPARRKLLSGSDSKPKSSRSFLGFAAPVLTLILGKLAAFGVMTHVAANLPGEATLAGHQIILSLFFFISPFMEVISQTAQAFLPPFITNNSEEGAQIFSRRLLKLGIILASIVSSLAACIPKFVPQWLSNDPMVHAATRPLALPLAVAGVLTAPVAVSEGILLARRELKFLASVYVLSTLAFPFGLFQIKYGQGPVISVWYGFAIFQLFRALAFTGKIWWGPKLINKVSSLFSKKDSNDDPITA